MAKHREIPAPDPVIESDLEESETEESDSEPEPQTAKKAPAAAAKLQKPLAKAPAPAESSDSETEESDSEPEPEPAKKAPVTAPSAKAAAPPADSSSGSEYESDSDDGLPPKKPDSNGINVKRNSSKPMATEKDAVPVKTATANRATPATGMKRSATPSVTQEADTKRSKIEDSVKKGAATEEGKKLFERIFTPEDEIIVLEELLKKYPISKESSEMDSVYEAIKGRVSVPVSKTQVQDKIRRLRVRFFNKKEKFANKKEKKKKKKGSITEEEGGKDDLETVAFELSKKIWGNEEGPKTGNKGSTRIAVKYEEAVEKAEGMENKEKEKSGLSFARDGKSVREWIFGEGTELVAEEARGNLEKEWKEIRKEEAQLYVKKLELSLKHAKIVYDSILVE